MADDRSADTPKGEMASDLKAALVEIETISHSAERYSNIIGVLTAVNALSFFAAALSLRINISNIVGRDDPFYLTLILLSPLFFILTVILLSKFEKITAVGNAYYQEISDSIEWDGADGKTRFDSRIRLKKFVISATLPFARTGNKGPAFYILIAAMFSISTVLLVLLNAR